MYAYVHTHVSDIRHLSMIQMYMYKVLIHVSDIYVCMCIYIYIYVYTCMCMLYSFCDTITSSGSVASLIFRQTSSLVVSRIAFQTEANHPRPNDMRGKENNWNANNEDSKRNESREHRATPFFAGRPLKLPLPAAVSRTSPHVHIQLYIHTYVCICMYVYIYIYT